MTFQSKTMSQGDEKDEIRICVSGPDGSDDSLHSSCEERLKPVVEHDSSDSDPSSSPEPQPKQGRAKCSFLITDILAETNSRVSSDNIDHNRDPYYRHFIPKRYEESSQVSTTTDLFSKHKDQNGNYDHL